MRRAAKERVRHGLRWAPEICPTERMTAITARPAAAAFPIIVSEPPVFSSTITAAVATNIKMNVPTNSAPIY